MQSELISRTFCAREPRSPLAVRQRPHLQGSRLYGVIALVERKPDVLRYW
jgi:hypothetical protein